MSNSIANLPPPWPNMAQALSKYTIELKEAQAEKSRRSGEGSDDAVRNEPSSDGGAAGSGSDSGRGNNGTIRIDV